MKSIAKIGIVAASAFGLWYLFIRDTSGPAQADQSSAGGGGGGGGGGPIGGGMPVIPVIPAIPVTPASPQESSTPKTTTTITPSTIAKGTSTSAYNPNQQTTVKTTEKPVLSSDTTKSSQTYSGTQLANSTSNTSVGGNVGIFKLFSGMPGSKNSLFLDQLCLKK